LTNCSCKYPVGAPTPTDKIVFRVTVAVPVTDGNMVLVAVTVTAVVEPMMAGAVYNPLVEMLPNCGLMDQVTVVTARFETVAVNCCVWLLVKDTVLGLMTMDGVLGLSWIVTVADWVGSATLVAVMVTVWATLMLAGAV